ncbi:uncharacterized protein LOC124342007 isoform X5 [Daphnia pulicaria]|uniref:uncharacterized protein LOC124342007 isoform X5 n=1 Tax=Daphnia pulicaria TaxID=35523 RepID=UPI001EEC311B|nr:uncharacterized protein LOC124342007 isoform X5 [Daphnia pulicaria]
MQQISSASIQISPFSTRRLKIATFRLCFSFASAEKTDFTYANSYSYRTQVTPERVICMPNMTRRSIERCHGFGFSSPELRLGSLGKTPDLNTSYRNAHESDDEIDETYHLKTPPKSYRSAAYCFSSVAFSKLKGIVLSLAWWIYLITCYSLLLDTCVLQSRGITKLRNLCRQQSKNSRNLLMLFLFLPLCFCAGGLLYSALHAFITRAEDVPSNTLVNPFPTQDLLPTLNSLSDSPSPMSNPVVESPLSIINPITDLSTSTLSPVEVPLLLSEDSSWQDLKYELKITKEAYSALKQQVNAYDGKISSLASQVELFQGQLMSVRTAEIKDCCDQSHPDMLEQLVGAKFASLIGSLSQQTGLNVDDVATTVSKLNGALKELKDLKEWKRSAEDKDEKWGHDISNMQNSLNEKELSMLTQIGVLIEEAIKRWETDSKPALIHKMKEDLIAEIRSQIKLVNANSGRGLSKDEVEQMIHSALGVYDSDKTGLADFALEPAGGVILSTRCTETYNSHRPRLSIWGFSLWSEPNNPRVVIQPGIVPGQCWSFRGFDGYLVIQLSRKIVPTAFTLEHIPRSLAPDGQIDSAPRNFTVYGLTREVDIAGVVLGQYTFDNLGVPLQSFPVQAHEPGAFSIVELRIHSNYGNLNYTCLYRFRVHGHVA